MNKDLEQWITEANPYRLSQRLYTNAKHFAWEEGATSMAIHLQEKQREKEDAGFVVGVEYQRKQPPTADDICKILTLSQVWSRLVEAEKRDVSFSDFVKIHWGRDIIDVIEKTNEN